MKQKHVSTPISKVWENEPQRREISWEILLYNLITGHSLKSKGAWISACLISQTWIQPGMSQADFPAPQPTTVGPPHQGVWRQRYQLRQHLWPLGSLCSLALLVRMRGDAVCPLLQNKEWVSHKSGQVGARRMTGEQQYQLGSAWSYSGTVGAKKGKAQTDSTQAEAARLCPKVRKSWDTRKVWKSIRSSGTQVPHKGDFLTAILGTFSC